ncbi:MAG: stress response translation initiation inhibitor YciH, partial [Candidatus Aenigmarchaeota archaeon]|nr:stress response translation initiation inhibitor YciH [Candidatus Aenigmarchaeota archaeon]
RKWNKAMTVIEGIDAKSVDLGKLATKLKSLCACGGSAKDNMILLQGDHRSKVKQLLIDYGFPKSSIEVR